MHSWITRDDYKECQSCGLQVENVVFDNGNYPVICSDNTECRANYSGGTHYLVSVPESSDEIAHSECYHCACAFV